MENLNDVLTKMKDEIDKIQLDITRLHPKMESDDEVKRLVVDRLNLFMYITEKKCMNKIHDLTDKLIKEIISACNHNFVPDNSFFDPCRTIMRCTKCGHYND